MTFHPIYIHFLHLVKKKHLNKRRGQEFLNRYGTFYLNYFSFFPFTLFPFVSFKVYHISLSYSFLFVCPTVVCALWQTSAKTRTSVCAVKLIATYLYNKNCFLSVLLRTVFLHAPMISLDSNLLCVNLIIPIIIQQLMSNSKITHSSYDAQIT